jgi:hypothetical protein
MNTNFTDIYNTILHHINNKNIHSTTMLSQSISPTRKTNVMCLFKIVLPAFRQYCLLCVFPFSVFCNDSIVLCHLNKSFVAKKKCSFLSVYHFIQIYLFTSYLIKQKYQRKHFENLCYARTSGMIDKTK